MAYKIPSIESFYPGTYMAEPSENYGEYFTGYRLEFGRIGAPTSPQTANQITEASARLSEGTKLIELGALQPETFETIPKQQFNEVNQLMKLTGARASLHAPLVDPAGFTREGWTEYTRQDSERHILQSVEKAHLLDEKGNVPVTLHVTGGIPIGEWIPEKGPNGKDKLSVLYVVNRETGELGPIKREVIASPIPFYEKDKFGEFKRDEKGNPIKDNRAIPIYKKDNSGRQVLAGYELDPELRLEEHNQRQWTEPISNIEYNKSIIENRLDQYAQIANDLHMREQLGEQLSADEKKRFDMIKMELRTTKNLMEDYDLALRNLYHRAYTFSDDKSKQILLKEIGSYQNEVNEIDKLRNVNGKFLDDQELIKRYPDRFAQLVERKSETGRILIDGLRKVRPEVYIKTEDFALEKTKETLRNVAWQAYKQFGDKAPVLCVENFFPNTVFSRADSLKNLVEESRKAFVEKAKKEGMNEDSAKAVAKRLIGVTWDLGHINLLRKHGYGEEEGRFKPEKFAKIMAKEAKEIAPFVKHVHLTDNFGYNDTHLPPGMGEVPFKEVLRELEKAGYSGRHIVEAGGMIAQKLGMPTPYVLEAFGSPLYGAAAAPYWNAMKMTYGFPQGYYSGYGMMLPEQHFSTYGSGFSSLPQELGGQMPGKGQRFSGAPME
jgi:hypothetical protein